MYHVTSHSLHTLAMSKQLQQLYQGMQNLGCTVKASTEELDAAGKPLTHTVIGGVGTWHRGKKITSGCLSLPDRSLWRVNEMLLAKLDAGAPVSWHEVAARGKDDPRRLVLDFDYKAKLKAPAELEFLISLIERGFERCDMSACGKSTTFAKAGLKLTDELILEAHATVRVQLKMKGGASLPFLALMKIYLQCSRVQPDVLKDLVKPRFAEPISKLVGIAVGLVTQRCTAELVVEKVDLITAVLTSHGADAFDGKRVICSTHVVVPCVVVNEGNGLRVVEAVQAIIYTVPGAETYLDDNSVDRGIYNNGGGLRLPFTVKTKMCSACAESKSNHLCGECGGSRMLCEQRFYGPTALLNNLEYYEAPQAMHTNERWVNQWYTSRPFVLASASARLGVRQLRELTKFSSRPSKRPAVELLSPLQKKRLVKMVNHGTDVHPDTHVRLSNVDVLREHILAAPAYGRRQNVVPILPDDSRYKATEAIFGYLIEMVFDTDEFTKQRKKVAIRSMAIKYDSFGAPVWISVRLKGRAAQLCFNRRVAGPHDDPTRPGQHRQSTSHFTLYREMSGYGFKFKGFVALEQRCTNTKSDDTRRSQCSCKDWKGIVRRVKFSSVKSKEEAMKNRENLRSLFFEKSKMTDDESRCIFEKSQRDLLRRYRKEDYENNAMEKLCGPSELYNTLVKNLVLERT